MKNYNEVREKREEIKDKVYDELAKENIKLEASPNFNAIWRCFILNFI